MSSAISLNVVNYKLIVACPLLPKLSNCSLTIHFEYFRYSKTYEHTDLSNIFRNVPIVIILINLFSASPWLHRFQNWYMMGTGAVEADVVTFRWNYKSHNRDQWRNKIIHSSGPKHLDLIFFWGEIQYDLVNSIK